jgi:DNA polymerase III delta prime subunit
MPDIAYFPNELSSRSATHKYLASFRSDLAEHLRSGSHLILHGPRGSGKSTLVSAMLEDFRSQKIPCAIASQTTGLADVVTALSHAYADTDIQGLSRRATAVRLRLVADRVPGVLLLDHTCEVTTAMIGFMRRLKGGIIGALFVVDIDSAFERERLVGWRRHAPRVRMPLMPNRRLQRLLQYAWVARNLPEIDTKTNRYIVRAARGRVGWLRECIRHLEIPEYWSDGRLHFRALCTDCEIAIRQSRRGPRLRRKFKRQ